MQCGGYVVRNFKRARDTLQTRIDINPKKVCGKGKMIVDYPGSASLPDDASQTTPGMTKRDSAWYAQNGLGFGYGRNFSK